MKRGKRKKELEPGAAQYPLPFADWICATCCQNLPPGETRCPNCEPVEVAAERAEEPRV